MRYSGRRHWGIGKHGRIRNPSSKNQCNRSVDATKERRFHHPSTRWHRKIVSQISRIPRTHSKAGTTCGERSSQWRTSRRTGRAPTDRNKRWRWSPERLLVDWRWLYQSSARWNLEFDSVCRKKNHYSTEKNIDVTRSTHTNLDVMRETRINDYWRSLSDLWTGFTKFT